MIVRFGQHAVPGPAPSGPTSVPSAAIPLPGGGSASPKGAAPAPTTYVAPGGHVIIGPPSTGPSAAPTGSGSKSTPAYIPPKEHVTTGPTTGPSAPPERSPAERQSRAPWGPPPPPQVIVMPGQMIPVDTGPQVQQAPVVVFAPQGPSGESSTTVEGKPWWIWALVVLGGWWIAEKKR